MQNVQQNLPNPEIQHICRQCVGDPILAGEVRCRGEVHLCSYCNRATQAFPLDALAERIHHVMATHFELTPDHPVEVEEFITIALDLDWERKGDPATAVIADIAGLDQPIADDVTEWLSQHYGYHEVRYGGEDPYGFDAHYDHKDPDTSQLKNAWDNFRREIETQARFFGPYAETTLSKIFADLQTLGTIVGEPVIREIGPQDDERYVYRARKALSIEELHRILKSPTDELGPPPSKFAAAGRMNSAGIPVFYGAMDRNTCVAEIRPPVGSRVVTGQFEILKTVRLLDLNLLEQVFVETSHFDERYSEQYGRHAFLRQLVAEITAPVMPQDEAKEYLATQVIADFLAFKVSPRLDGILFRSSQTDGTGQNVVLFNHASHVEPILVPPGTNLDVSMPRTDVDDDFINENILIFEETNSDTVNQPQPETSAATGAQPDQMVENAGGEPAPTLRLHLDTRLVHDIKKMEPQFTNLPVRRVLTGNADLSENF